MEEKDKRREDDGFVTFDMFKKLSQFQVYDMSFLVLSCVEWADGFTSCMQLS